MKFFLREEFAEEIEGDMEEVFRDNLERFSPAKARRIYAWDAIKLMRPALIKNFQRVGTFQHYAMYKNYIKIAWRNLVKKKAYSFINIFGLGLGISCCLLIFLYVQNEFSFDAYHANKERIYRVVHGEVPKDSKDGLTQCPCWVWGNAPVGAALQNEFPEIDKVVQFSGRSDILLTYGEKKYQEDGIFFMDSTAFDVFSWKVISGNPKTALAAPYSIVLTQSTAKKYFGDEDPLGKTIQGSASAGRSDKGDYLVTAVIEDIPSNSHFRFNLLLSMSTFRKAREDVFSAWGYVDFYTYFLVNDKFDEATFKNKLKDFSERHREYPESRYGIAIEPLKDVYLRTEADRQPGETGNLSNIYIFSAIGVFILFIAIINFMNLSTARSLERGKEVGIRKSIGAQRAGLIGQFLGESMIIVLISSCVALVIVYFAAPAMDALTGKDLMIWPFVTLQSIGLFLIGVIFIGLLAGSYPALVLSRFNAVKILKGITQSDRGGVGLRKVLVVFQFSLSIALIAGTLVVYLQMDHLQKRELGFDRQQMLIVDYNYDQEVNKTSELIRNELLRNKDITSVAYSRSVPGSYYPHAGTEIETPDGQKEMKGQAIFQVGLDFITHYDLKLIAGRPYSREHPMDSSTALIINESAARQYGYSNPADAVGKKFSQWGREGEVIGVVKDFNFISLHRNIEPLTLPFAAYDSRYMSVKAKSNDMKRTVAEVESVWKELVPHRPFLYSFLDDDFNKQYQSDFMFRRLFTTFACLAIFIACLGLFGLATYTAERRTKEIGIRKVLGADVQSIVGLLSRDFVILVIIAIVIATPTAWYAMDKWLATFAYKMDMQAWIFAVAGFIALSIALITISHQAIRSAFMNPVSSLRSE